MRPIDSEALSEKVKHALVDVDQATCDADRQWASGYNAGLRWTLGYINKAEAITTPPNAPLTLEELREMDGEPVWVQFIFADDSGYRVIKRTSGLGVSFTDGRNLCGERYGKTWMAYRNKPENT